MSTLQNLIFENMDMVALKHHRDDEYIVVTPPPKWFAELWPAAHKRVPMPLRGPSPFLDNFLVDAGFHWSRSSGTLKSGPFLEQSPYSEEPYPLEASAFKAEREMILIITNLGSSYKNTLNLLQAARENLLTQETLETEVSKRTQDIRDRESEIAVRLIYAAGFRDEETGTHIKRIGLYSAEMAKALGWNQTAIDDIRAAAPMHDIGKIGIEDGILKKPGRLTEGEFTRMRQHAEIGQEMLQDSDVAMIRMAADIAGAHHEFWNGQGYPRQLKGDAIPVSARIVAIVDVYDALVHKRVYKKAFPESAALEMMTDLAGKQFDPDLLSLFLANIEVMRGIRKKVVDESEK